MRTHVRFRSELFKPIKSEEEQTNPGVYGEELSKWLFDNLPQYGTKTTDSFAEDWGWIVSLESRKFPVWIGCSNEGWEGEKTRWICFCQTSVGLFERIFKKTDPKPALEKTIEALKKLLESERGITEVEWYTVDKRGQEFDHAAVP